MALAALAARHSRGPGEGAGRGDTTLVRGVHAPRRVRLGACSKSLAVATRQLFSNHPE